MKKEKLLTIFKEWLANSDEYFTSLEDTEIFYSPIKYISPPFIKLSSNKNDAIEFKFQWKIICEAYFK